MTNRHGRRQHERDRPRSAANVAKTGGGTTLTIKYKEGEKKIDVTPETPIVMYAPGSKDELKPGAAIYITAATQGSRRHSVGQPHQCRPTGVVPPM